MDQPEHAPLRSFAANTSSNVFGLSTNKHGLSLPKITPSDRQASQFAVLPPLNLTIPPSSESSAAAEATKRSEPTWIEETDCESFFRWTTTTSGNTSFPASDRLTDACRTLLFATTSLHGAVRRCFIFCISQEHSDIISTLQKSKVHAEKLVQALDRAEKQTSPSGVTETLVKAAKTLIAVLKDLCTQLQACTQSLDSKFARHLLLHVYSATVDIKDAYETLHGSTVPVHNISSSTPTSHPSTSSSTTCYFRSRSQSEQTTATSSSLPVSEDNNLHLYHHLKLAVTTSLHVVDLLKQSIEDTVTTEIPNSLRTRLYDLARQCEQAAEMATLIDQRLASDAWRRREEGPRFFQEANGYLKV